MCGQFKQPCAAAEVEGGSEGPFERPDHLGKGETGQCGERSRVLRPFAPIELRGDCKGCAQQQLYDAHGIYRVVGQRGGIDDRREREHCGVAPDLDEQSVETRAGASRAAVVYAHSDIGTDEGDEGAPQYLRRACESPQSVFEQGCERENRSPQDEVAAAYTVHAPHVALEDAGDKLQRLLFRKAVVSRFHGSSLFLVLHGS